LLAKQYGVTTVTKERIDNYYNDLMKDVKAFSDIFKVDATISQSASFKEKYEWSIDQEIKEWQKRNNAIDGPVVIEPGRDEVVVTIQKQKVKASELIVVKTLSSEEDVKQYISTLSNKLMQIINANKHIEFIE
jgi:arsenate reductase-like glutaredoxin family protein